VAFKETRVIYIT